jgi:hypothetical protein
MAIPRSQYEECSNKEINPQARPEGCNRVLSVCYNYLFLLIYLEQTLRTLSETYWKALKFLAIPLEVLSFPLIPPFLRCLLGDLAALFWGQLCGACLAALQTA